MTEHVKLKKPIPKDILKNQYGWGIGLGRLEMNKVYEVHHWNHHGGVIYTPRVSFKKNFGREYLERVKQEAPVANVKTVLYEVGTFERHEAGFHAFYRTLNKDKALKVLELAKDCHAKLPEYDSDTDEIGFLEYHYKNNEIDWNLQDLTKNDFNISNYQGDLYTIEMREVTLDD